MKWYKSGWFVVLLVVLVTIAVLSTTSERQSAQISKDGSKTTPTPRDYSKYPVVSFEATENLSPADREIRTLKNKRYDASVTVRRNPHPETVEALAFDVEPEPSPLPSKESNLVIIGTVRKANSLLTEEKKGIFSEFVVEVEEVTKEDRDKNIGTGDTITIDRAGGVIEYPNGQKILYRLDWQDLPIVGGRYLFFLVNNDHGNPNYKVLTAYELVDGKTRALDNPSMFGEYSGKTEKEVVRLISSKN